MHGRAKPDLSTETSILSLDERPSPYWNILEYCRHLGIHKPSGKPVRWVARIRRKNGGYTQTQLAIALDAQGWITTRTDAERLARSWFASPITAELSSKAFPVGTSQSLRYHKTSSCFTVGDALNDYVEWKRLAAAPSHFETNLSLINFHIVPRLGDVDANAFTGRSVTAFCRDILETPPKRGNQRLGERQSIDSLSPEALRKRKKTVNTLLSILRISLKMAWENGDLETERSWRCIRNMPNHDAPRHLFLTRDQCRRLINHCRPDLRDLVQAALFTGCRVSELSRMRVGDVGAGVFGVHVAPSKNGRARYVVLPLEGMTFFLHFSKQRPPDEWLFRMGSGRKWEGNHKHLFKDATRAAGLPDAFVFHGLRHTYASQLVQAGTPLAVVASQLGHSNTDTVSRTYGHLCCDSIAHHLERGFAPLLEDPQIDDDAIAALREQLSLGLCLPVHSTDWPKSNFATSSFVGPRRRIVAYA